jgi:hypothetical protein
MTFTQAMKMMDLMSPATFVGQSSTIEKGTVMKVMKTRLNWGLRYDERMFWKHEFE